MRVLDCWEMRKILAPIGGLGKVDLRVYRVATCFQASPPGPQSVRELGNEDAEPGAGNL